MVSLKTEHFWLCLVRTDLLNALGLAGSLLLLLLLSSDLGWPPAPGKTNSRQAQRRVDAKLAENRLRELHFEFS